LGRALDARELSDGTLRYLCLLAALLTPRPPKVLALNEPESSLHPDLLAPLGKLIAEASHETQLWITTHSRELAWAIEEHSGASPVKLHKVEDETRLVLPDPEVVEPATPVVTSDGGDADETEERTVSVRYVFD